MELQFTSNTVTCLKCVIHEVQSREQTQELKVGDGMPDVGRVIQAWGQPVLRSKEWHADEIRFSGGMMVWVLYCGEGEKAPQVLSGWIPFQMEWDLPENVPDGDIMISCLCRFVDARSVSPRKILVRCGMSVLCKAYVPDSFRTYVPTEEDGSVELLRSRYPLRLNKFAGEKTFLLDEELSVPESVPLPQKIIYCTVDGCLQEGRVLADKVVFRGNGKVHLLYSAEGGQFHSWDFEVPFSQFAQLGESAGTDAQTDVWLAATDLETELEESGKLRIKCAMTAQYLVSDKETVEVIEDAYSTRQELNLEREILKVPVILERQKTNLYGEQNVNLDADLTADVHFLPDFPTQRRQGDRVELSYPGVFQLLTYGADGELRGTASRWEGKEILQSGVETQLRVLPQPAQVQSAAGNGTVALTVELPVERSCEAEQTLSAVREIHCGQERKLDPGRPSLILRRPGKCTLWDLAKENGSSVEAIRNLNGLEGEPEEEKMLLIPVK